MTHKPPLNLDIEVIEKVSFAGGSFIAKRKAAIKAAAEVARQVRALYIDVPTRKRSLNMLAFDQGAPLEDPNKILWELHRNLGRSLECLLDHKQALDAYCETTMKEQEDVI